MSVTNEQVESALKQYTDPYLGKDPVTAGVVKDITIDGDKVSVKIVLGYPAYGFVDELTEELRNKVEAAYRRTDLFEKRRDMMQAWASYVVGAGAKVVRLGV